MPEHQLEIVSHGTTETIQDLGEILSLVQQIRSQGGAVGGGGIGGAGIGPGGVSRMGPSLFGGGAGHVPSATHLVRRLVGEIAPGYGRAASIAMRILTPALANAPGGMPSSRGGGGFGALPYGIAQAAQAAQTVGFRHAVPPNVAYPAMREANRQLARMTGQSVLARNLALHARQMASGMGSRLANIPMGLMAGGRAIAPFVAAQFMIESLALAYRSIRDIHKPTQLQLDVTKIWGDVRYKPERFAFSRPEIAKLVQQHWLEKTSVGGKLAAMYDYMTDPKEVAKSFGDWWAGRPQTDRNIETPEVLAIESEVLHHSRYLNSKASAHDMFLSALDNPKNEIAREQIYRKYNREAFIEYHSGYIFQESERKQRYRGKAGVN